MKKLEINEWWAGIKEENIWLEITQRKDIGSDLHAPQFAEDGVSEHYSYSLLKYVKDGDFVLHYYKNKKSIIGYSVVDGTCYEDDITWKALGSSASKLNITAYIRPGFKIGLKNFQFLKSPVTLEKFKSKSKEILNIKKNLELKVKGKDSLYFPFSFSKKDLSLRGAIQGYLVKFPKLITNEFSEFDVLNIKNEYTQKLVNLENLGDDYRYADEDIAPSKRQPFETDPDIIDRGSKAHKKLQNDFANFLIKNNIKPERPNNSKINFDIGWRNNNKYFIAEIKSITEKNEEKQLRLGLGQILRYLSKTDRNLNNIIPVLIAEKIIDKSWHKTCKDYNVKLLTPENFENILKY